MLAEELVDLIHQICNQKTEGQTIEVKAAHEGTPQWLYDTLSSFSNQNEGGVIVFGLDKSQNYEIVGVYDPQDLQKKVAEQCRQMEPPVSGLFTIAEMDGVYVCSCEIPALELAVRPCYYKGAGRLRGSYIRVGDGNLHMTDQEIYGFEAFRQHIHEAERPVERADLKQFDQTALDRYYSFEKRNLESFNGMSDQEAYEMMHITRNGRPTLAAVLNFARYPQGYFPQLCITAVAVPGTAISDVPEDHGRFLEYQRIEGTIPEMLEKAMVFCRRNMKTRTVIDPATGLRADRTEYPADALREAILNALIHRDYSDYTQGTPVRIELFSDRVEIHSPGRLYGHLRVEQLGCARPELRNPSLAVMAEVLTGAGNRYSGIPAMRRAMKAYGLPAPKFENRRDEFVVTLYNTPEEIAVNEPAGSSVDLLAYCQTPRTRQEIASFLGIRTVSYAMNRYVNPLLKEGRLKMTLPQKPQSSRQKFYTVR